MVKKFSIFFRKISGNYLEAVTNLILFFPYFFSIPLLIKTLFYPWKNLYIKKYTAGFSLSEWFNRLSFNLISRVIGFLMRTGIIIFYFFFQSIFILLLPLITVLLILLSPLFFLKSFFEPTEEEKKEKLKLKFIGTHLLDQQHYKEVLTWFEDYYRQYLRKSVFWKRSNLFSIPPLARDWAVGYTPLLDNYCEDLTSTDYQAKVLSIVDRQKEIEQIEKALCKSQEANVIIIGDVGVGKHAIINSLAKNLYEGRTSTLLVYKRVLKLNVEKILNQYVDQKQRENFLETLFKEAAQAGNIILFIDDIDRYVVANENRVDLTLPLQKYAKMPDLQFIGVTTPFFYQKYIYPNDQLRRLFVKVDVFEVEKNDALKILLQIALRFESRHRFSIPYETVINTVEKSDFYITNIPFPEKAIDLLDTACADFEERNKDKLQPVKLLTPDIIDYTLTQKTHIPTTLTEKLKEKLLHLEDLLSKKIIHQEEAIKKIASGLRRAFLLIGKRKKPLASFLFLGQTGVGKTQTAKILAKTFFGSDLYLSRLDMSEYQTEADVAKLIGSLEKGNPGLLTEKVRENPYGVLLLDEIEKAHHSILNIFLTVLDEAYFTDGFGKNVDCKNLLIIATSNAGADILYQLTSSQISPSSFINLLVERKIFSPELLNRFDDIIVFNPLDKDDVFKIGRIMLRKIADDILKLHKVKLEVSDDYLKQIITSYYDQKFGARNLERLLKDTVEEKIARLILEGKVKDYDTIKL